MKIDEVKNLFEIIFKHGPNLDYLLDEPNEIALAEEVYDQLKMLKSEDDMPENHIEKFWQVVTIFLKSNHPLFNKYLVSEYGLKLFLEILPHLIQSKQYDLIALFANKGVSICDNFFDYPTYRSCAIQQAISSGDSKALITILENGQSTEEARTKALIIATTGNNPEMARILAGKGVDYNYRDKLSGYTALNYVLRYLPPYSGWSDELGINNVRKTRYKHKFEFINLYLPKTREFNLSNEVDKKTFLEFLMEVGSIIAAQKEVKSDDNKDELMLDEIKSKFSNVLEEFIRCGKIRLDTLIDSHDEPKSIQEIIDIIDPNITSKLEENKNILYYQNTARTSFTLFASADNTQKTNIQQRIEKEDEYRPLSSSVTLIKFAQ